MNKTAIDMIKALRRDAFCGVILYQGPSLIDGAPIVVIANRIVADSTNEKTGAMVQTFILRADMRPLDAARLGYDYSICGHCPHRPSNAGSCYVIIGRSVESVFGAYKRGRYAVPHVDYDVTLLPDLFADSIFRLGSYGDPAAAPFRGWQHATQLVRARNGYTHQWREFPAFAALCMASVDSEAQATEARSRSCTERMWWAPEDRAPPRRPSKASSAAFFPKASLSTVIVVRGGSEYAASSMSSKPISETSRGTEKPRSFNPRRI